MASHLQQQQFLRSRVTGKATVPIGKKRAETPPGAHPIVPSSAPPIQLPPAGPQGFKGKLLDFLRPTDQQGQGQLGLMLALAGKAFNPQGPLSDFAIRSSQGNIAEAGERADRAEFTSELERLLAAREGGGAIPGGGAPLDPGFGPPQPVSPTLPAPPLNGSFPGDPRMQAGAASFPGGGGGFNGGGELERLLAARGQGAPTANFPASGRSSSAGGRFSGLFPEQIGEIFGRENRRRASFRALDQRKVEGEARVTAAATLLEGQRSLQEDRQKEARDVATARALQDKGVSNFTIGKLTAIAADINLQFEESGLGQIRAYATLLLGEDRDNVALQQEIRSRILTIVEENGLDIEEVQRVSGIALTGPVQGGQLERGPGGELQFTAPRAPAAPLTGVSSPSIDLSTGSGETPKQETIEQPRPTLGESLKTSLESTISTVLGGLAASARKDLLTRLFIPTETRGAIQDLLSVGRDLIEPAAIGAALTAGGLEREATKAFEKFASPRNKRAAKMVGSILQEQLRAVSFDLGSSAERNIEATKEAFVVGAKAATADVKAKISAELQNHREDREFQREKLKEEQRSEARKEAREDRKELVERVTERALRQHEARLRPAADGSMILPDSAFSEELFEAVLRSRERARAGIRVTDSGGREAYNVSAHMRMMVRITELQLKEDIADAIAEAIGTLPALQRIGQ